MVYEYNPLRNYRLPKDTDINGKHRGEEGFIDDDNVIEGGSVVDLDTSLLNFSLNNPVNITVQKSYDGSDNLILNDNRNIPRLINTRFSVLPKNRYEIVDRLGNNDTNLYDDTQFDQDTSLYKRINYIPLIKFDGVLNSGNLKVGNYTLYIKYADADGNETDFVAESGLISCFIGADKDPFSIQGGFRDQTSNKSIQITVENIDPSYDYIKVYFTRTTSDVNQSQVVTAYKINQKYRSSNNISTIIITGNEDIEEIPLSDINVQYFVADKVYTQAQCQNMLFLGNINKPDIQYADLQDLSLRIYPTLKETTSKDLIGEVDSEYVDNTISINNYEYYNTKNIYNYVGYWNEELYRIGVVYILNDYTLSPVFNIRGTRTLPTSMDYYSDVPQLYTSEGERNYISIVESNYNIEGTDDNSKGVIYIPKSDKNGIQVNSIQIHIPRAVLEYLNDNIKIKGLFFVRQKRIPTILCQTAILPIDTVSGLPALKGTDDKWFIEGFLTSTGYLLNNYKERLKYVEIPTNNDLYAGICPEFDVREPYFNQFFTGTSFPLTGYSSNNIVSSIYNNRRYVITYNSNCKDVCDSKVLGISDDMPMGVIEENIFRGRAGAAEEAYKFEYIGQELETKNNYNLVRGSFGPYLGMVSPTVSPLNIYNIRIPGYSLSQIDTYFNIRYYDDSPYYPITDRISLDDIESQWAIEDGYFINDCYRGDCYICNFTHRVNRNFQDPETPINDDIVDPTCWVDNYDVESKENYDKINRGDVNAIKLGSWVSVKVLSSYNLNIRSQDHSYPDEESLTGNPRSFYPLQYTSEEGSFKIPESGVINNGYGISSGEKLYYNLPDVPYIKNRFDNRILYSDIAVTDAFKNGFRVFQFQHYRDYPKVYGGLIKIIELYGQLLVVWEHGVGLIPVNERAVAGEGQGGQVYINTSNVLPENPKILSSMYGSQWQESIIKTQYYVYGVDTVAKKIWRTNGTQFEIISDFRIQEFLNNNISLSEREIDPIIGIRNVKTHYNAYKSDVMFTFYDNNQGFEEKVWNICYNEILQKWITFYSWIPSYSSNIDNIYFSFNRDTSKYISKLGCCTYGNPSADGVTLNSPIIEDWNDGVQLTLSNRDLPNDSNTGIQYEFNFTLERDNYQNYKLFNIKNNKLYYTGKFNSDGNVDISQWKYPVLFLNIKCEINLKIDPDFIENPIEQEEYSKGWNDYYSVNEDLYKSSIAVTSRTIINNPASQKLNLTTDFWKHGQAGIIDIKEKIKPCLWYGKQHPFEFEVVVVDNPSTHKLFDNLQIIGNKATPESFHYEIIGECFDFAKDKKNMFIRQEVTKDFYQYNGSDILYNRKLFELQPEQNKKSISLPLYYSRNDTFNEVEDYYKQMTTPNKDYSNLSGSEIVYYENLNEFRIWEHSKAVDIEVPDGRIRGNMNYQEDKWNIQINPIVIVEKNELNWNTEDNFGNTIKPKVPITIGNSPVPNDFYKNQISYEDIPQDLREDLGYTLKDIDISNWGVYAVGRDQDGNVIYADANTRREVKVKDKFVKIRVRYSGEDLAIISALKTLYSISYA